MNLQQYYQRINFFDAPRADLATLSVHHVATNALNARVVLEECAATFDRTAFQYRLVPLRDRPLARKEFDQR